MKRIPLTKGMYALIDDEDLELVSQHSWCYANGYAQTVTYEGKGKPRRCLLMHRLIMGFPSITVDHRNGDRLDNRRSNLRLATYSQQAGNSVGFGRFKKGVHFVGPRSYQAVIRMNGKQIGLGSFATEDEAHEAYNKAAFQKWGEFAVSQREVKGERE